MVTEEDWVDFARQQAEPGKRARLEQHLEKGCSRCARTLRLWRAVLDVADREGALQSAGRGPPPAPRHLRAPPSQAAARSGSPSARRSSSTAFVSRSRPGVRAAGPAAATAPLQGGPYSIRVRARAGSGGRAALHHRADRRRSRNRPARSRTSPVLALKGNKTLDRTLTNHLGEFALEPDAAENLRLSRRRGRDRDLHRAAVAARAEGPVGRRPGQGVDGAGRRKRARQR